MKGKHSLLIASVLGAVLLFLAACGGSTPGQTGSQQTSGSSLVGTWTGHCSVRSLDFKRAEFRDDGTLVMDNNVGKYSINGNQVQISFSSYTFEYSYSISQSGNVLTLSDSSGGFCSVGRAGTNEAQETAQSLVGVWVGPCQNLRSAGDNFNKIEFRSNGTAVFDGSDTEPYTVPDPGRLVFSNLRLFSDNSPITWSFLVSGSTLRIVANFTGSPTCSLQKSA